MFAWPIQIIRVLDSQSKFQMFTLFAAAMYTNMAAPYWAQIVQKIIFQQIYEDGENVQT